MVIHIKVVFERHELLYTKLWLSLKHYISLVRDITNFSSSTLNDDFTLPNFNQSQHRFCVPRYKIQFQKAPKSRKLTNSFFGVIRASFVAEVIPVFLATWAISFCSFSNWDWERGGENDTKWARTITPLVETKCGDLPQNDCNLFENDLVNWKKKLAVFPFLIDDLFN